MSPINFVGALGISLSVGFFGGWAVNGMRLDAKFQKARAVQAESVVGKVSERIVDNSKVAIKQEEASKKIEEKSNEEIKPVIARINAAPRLRVGPAVCGGVAATSKAESASVSAETDTGGGLVREDVDRDIKALKIEVEESFKAGRACQAFLKANGLEP